MDDPNTPQPTQPAQPAEPAQPNQTFEIPQDNLNAPAAETPAAAEPPAATPPPTAETPAEAPAEAPTETPPKAKSLKKYIIIGVGAVVALGLIYVAYSFFSGGDTATEQTASIAPTNKLSGSLKEATEAPSKEMEELEEVVNELKAIYEEDASVAPPSIKIDFFEEDFAEEEAEEETSKKKRSR